MGLWINTDGMSFEDLMKKETEVRKKMLMAYRCGVSPETMEQFHNILDDVRAAMNESNLKKTMDDKGNDIFDGLLDIG